MRRALSSDSGFLEFLDLDFGFSRLPSLRVHGSGVTEDKTITGLVLDLRFFEGLEGWVLNGVVQMKEDFRTSID